MTIPRNDPAYSSDEATMLREFLDYYRATVRRQADGLTSAQLATTLAPSTMTLGGMLKHLALVEHWWLVVVFLGRDAAEQWSDDKFVDDDDWDWHSASEDTPEELARLFDEAVVESNEITDAALAAGTLDVLAVMPRREGKQPSLRWILVHLIEEYARHAGHADLIRESIDGATDL